MKQEPSPLKGAQFLILQKVDNGVIVRASMNPYLPASDGTWITVRVFSSFTDLCREIADVFEIPDSENIAKGG